jgi:competence protein ComEA
MELSFLRLLPRAVARVVGSRWAKPIARALLAAAGLVLLAVIGQTAVAGALAASAAGAASANIAVAPAESSASLPPTDAPLASTSTATNAPISSHGPASADDPVILNDATEADLRRLPGIGAKRADAILSLRARLGRFRAVEDLLKVKGIGRATLKRLRPLVRLDPPRIDAGLPQPVTSSR